MGVNLLLHMLERAKMIGGGRGSPGRCALYQSKGLCGKAASPVSFLVTSHFEFLTRQHTDSNVEESGHRHY